MSKSRPRRRATKAGLKLARLLRETYEQSSLVASDRRRVMENCIGWAYAHGHEVPQTPTEFNGLICGFEVLFDDAVLDRWHDAYKQMNADRQQGISRACAWWRVLKTMSRTNPMPRQPKRRRPKPWKVGISGAGVAQPRGVRQSRRSPRFK